MLRRRQAAIVAATLVVVMPILYALAAGPFVYMERIGRPVLSVEAFLWIYHPLIRAEARIPPLGRAMHFYVGLWERAAESRSHRDKKVAEEATRQGVDVESNHFLPPGLTGASASNASTPKIVGKA